MSSGSQESRVRERTLEKCTPRLLLEKQTVKAQAPGWVCACSCVLLCTCVFPSRRCTAWCPGWWRPSQDRALRSRSTACSPRWPGPPPAPCSPRSPDPRILRPHFLLQNCSWTLSCSAVSDNVRMHESGDGQRDSSVSLQIKLPQMSHKLQTSLGNSVSPRVCVCVKVCVLTGLCVSSLRSWKAEAMLFWTAVIHAFCCLSESACNKQHLHTNTHTKKHTWLSLLRNSHGRIFTTAASLSLKTHHHRPNSRTHARRRGDKLTLTEKPPQSRIASRFQRWAWLCRDAGPPPQPWAAPEKDKQTCRSDGTVQCSVCTFPLSSYFFWEILVYLEFLLIHQLIFLNWKPASGEGGGRKLVSLQKLIRKTQMVDTSQFNASQSFDFHSAVKLVPAPGLESVAGSLIEVALHCNPISCVRIEIHNGVIVGHVLEIFKRCTLCHCNDCVGGCCWSCSAVYLVQSLFL